MQASMLLLGVLMTTVHASEELPEARVDASVFGSPTVVWEPSKVETVEIRSTLLGWDESASSDVMIDTATLAVVSEGHPVFARGSFSLPRADARIEAAASAAGPGASALYAELVLVVMTDAAHPTRHPTSSPHWRYFSHVGGEVTELTRGEWDALVDPVQTTVRSDGTVQRTQRGTSVALPPREGEEAEPSGTALQVED
jgi:hypothetical protein